MAAAVLQPMQGLSLDREIMPPSPISQNSSRHGRSRHGGSIVKGGKARGRGYSIVDDRAVTVSKALSWVLKRTVQEDEGQNESEDKLVADAEGWVDCEDVLTRPNLSSLKVTFPELQSLISSAASKGRFSLKLDSDSSPGSTDPSDYLIRANPVTKEPASPTTASAPILRTLTTTSEDVPDLIVYETSYANYPLILASDGIKRAGGQPLLSFSSIKISEDGNEVRTASDADVSIYIDLRSAMEQDTKITWSRTETGAVVTEGDSNGVVSKAFWKKVVARRADIGVLFENGEVKKEVPIGLRGKGAKPKKGGKGRGKGIKEMKARSEDEESTSD